MRAIFQLVLAGCRKTVLQTAVRIVKKRKPLSTIKRRDVQGCRKGLSMLDVKRVLKAAPTKMRSREPLQQLWTPWGERIDHEWLSARAGNKAFNPAEEGERTLDEGRTPILGEHPRPTMVRDNCTMLNGWWDYAIASIPEDETAPKWRKTAAMLTRDEAVRAVKETAIPQTFDGKILVPFSPESALSGVHQTIYPDNLLWYRTVVHPVTLGGEETVRQIGDANRLILHFEAVDYVCACYVNGQLAGTHVGGYLPFDVDISAFIDLMTRLKSRCASTIRTIRARSCAASRKSSAKASGTPRKAAFGKASGWKSCRKPTCAR